MSKVSWGIKKTKENKCALGIVHDLERGKFEAATTIPLDQFKTLLSRDEFFTLKEMKVGSEIMVITMYSPRFPVITEG